VGEQITFGAALKRARTALKLSQKQFAGRVDTNPRTISRWESELRTPSRAAIGQVVRFLHTLAPALAAEVATAGGTSLEAAGIAPPPPAAPLPRLLNARDASDAVVLAVVEGFEIPPARAREVLRVALRRAASMGLGLAELERGLAVDPAPARG
jgi:transcriptional regulator with XRE-family HTH domain